MPNDSAIIRQQFVSCFYRLSDGNASAHLLWTRKIAVGLHDRGERCVNIGSDGRGNRRAHVHVHKHLLGGAHELVTVTVIHGVKQVQSLLVQVQQLCREAQRLAKPRLTMPSLSRPRRAYAACKNHSCRALPSPTSPYRTLS